jgi:hypothetical protein
MVDRHSVKRPRPPTANIFYMKYVFAAEVVGDSGITSDLYRKSPGGQALCAPAPGDFAPHPGGSTILPSRYNPVKPLTMVVAPEV